MSKTFTLSLDIVQAVFVAGALYDKEREERNLSMYEFERDRNWSSRTAENRANLLKDLADALTAEYRAALAEDTRKAIPDD